MPHDRCDQRRSRLPAAGAIDVSESIASGRSQGQRCQGDIGARKYCTLLVLRWHCAALTPRDIDLSPLIATEFP
jgi:hypothetical protein